MVNVGNFFFRWRNQVFPAIIAALYLLKPPPSTVFGSASLEYAMDVLAITFAAAGLVLRAAVIGYSQIRLGGVNKKVYAKDLVTDGMFGVCRNPLYLGNILIYTGLFLMHGDPDVMTAGIASFLFIYASLVAAEEAYLADKFGAAYSAYCAEVPRWLPDWSRFKEATGGMEFNVSRVITKGYTTMAATLVALTLTEGYDFLARPDAAQHKLFLAVLAYIVVLCGLGAAGVRLSLKNARI